MLKLVGLDHLADRYPFQLSGGQQQRVALARALAIKPQVLLLDEPLSALDAKIRVSLREEIRDIQRKMGITTIFVTHDQEEALSISDRIVVMHQGKADQIGTPHEIYNRPSTRFVASFVGTLSMIEAVVADPAANTVTVNGATAQVSQPLTGKKAATRSRSRCDPRRCRWSRAGVATCPSPAWSMACTSRICGAHAAQGRWNDAVLDAFNDPSHPPPSIGDTVAAYYAPRDLLVIGD